MTSPVARVVVVANDGNSIYKRVNVGPRSNIPSCVTVQIVVDQLESMIEDKDRPALIYLPGLPQDGFTITNQ